MVASGNGPERPNSSLRRSTRTNIESHHESQHAESWAAYQELARAEKEAYFAG